MYFQNCTKRRNYAWGGNSPDQSKIQNRNPKFMTSREFTDQELEAYLDEDLSSHEMGQLEESLRDESESTGLIERLTSINRRRDSGVHSLGEIWRNHRVSCPTREQLGSYLLGVMSKEESDYLEFHIHRLGCRQCAANMDDLKSKREKTEKEESKVRQRKYFQTSAGYLKRDK